MIRAITTALLLAGLGAPAASAGTGSAPEPQFSPAPEMYSFSSSSAGRSYLGVDIKDVTADRVGPLKLKEERGVEVTLVDQDAPAGKAGIKEQDVILEFNGTAVESQEQLRRMLRETPPGRTVTLGISRDGNPIKISVQLADRGKIEKNPAVAIPAIPWPDKGVWTIDIAPYLPTLGIQTENLGRQLAEYFGVSEGILVRSVEKGSPAEKAGLKAGDVIVRADNQKLSDRADLSHILRNHRDGGKLPLGVVRDKHEQNIVVDLPQRNPKDSRWRVAPPVDFPDWSDFHKGLQEMMEDLRPQIEQAQEMASLQARSAMEQARQQVREARPAIDRAMRQAQEEWRRAKRLLEEQQKEIRDKLHTMI